MKVRSFLVMLLGGLIGGCASINYDRPSYAVDTVVTKGHYLGDPTSEPVFKEYDLYVDYSFEGEDINIQVDPVEIYTQSKSRFVEKEEVYYKRIGPYGYSPPRCFISVVTVFNVLFATFDKGIARDLKKMCNKVYEWERYTRDVDDERLEDKAVTLVGRNYIDSEGAVDFLMRANGNVINHSRLTGFSETNRKGAYSWSINEWYDFSRVDDDASISIELKNKRKRGVVSKTITLSDEDAEAIIFQSKYDGLVQYYYVCSKCNADLSSNYYSDTQRIVWFSNKYKYKSGGGLDLDRVASCLSDRFDTTKGNGFVRTMRASTPEGARRWHKTYQAYGQVRTSRGVREPKLADLQSCVRAKNLDIEFE